MDIEEIKKRLGTPAKFEPWEEYDYNTLSSALLWIINKLEETPTVSMAEFQRMKDAWAEYYRNHPSGVAGLDDVVPPA